MENANLNRSLTRTFYRLSQKYGTTGSISKRTSSTTDFVTGKTKQTVETRNLRKLVRVATSGDSREVIYTASMMQSLRPFAWQGGPGQNIKHAVFLIYKNELRNWEVSPEQWIRWGGQNWQVVSHLKNEGGWIIEAKVADGYEDGVIVTVDDDLDLEQSEQILLPVGSGQIGTSFGVS